MNKKLFGFVGGALVAGVAVAATLLALPGVHADGVVAVHATDSGYQGVPGNLPAGEARFSFTNEMSLFRINDGVNESFDQILADDEAQQKQADSQQGAQQGGQSGGQQGGQNAPADQAPPPPKMTYFGGNGAGPGASAKMDLIGNLPAGRYGIASFVPTDESGTPDYKKGLKAEFTVK
jgi:hypothetical protein